VKRDSKSDVWIITYPHSATKHLENELARRARDAFVNIFGRRAGIVTQRVARSILYADSKPWSQACEQLARGVNADQVFKRLKCESISLRVFPLGVFLRSSAAPTILRPARFWKRGERANRRRCARRRRFTKRCRFKTCSNAGTVALCLNVSKRDLLDLARARRK
jgi:hypothetical protein